MYRLTLLGELLEWLVIRLKRAWGWVNFLREVIQDTLRGWTQSGATLHAAALSFFTLLSMAPLIVLTVVIVSRFFSQPSVEARLVTEVGQRIGLDAARYVQGIIQSNRSDFSGKFTTVVSLLILLYSASTMFYQLQVSLNLIWGFPPPGKNLKQSLLSVLKTRSLAALFALSLGIVLMISLLAQTILEFIPKQFFYNFSPGLEQYRWIISLLGPPVLLVLVFGVLFKILLGRRSTWRNVWPGAIMTTVLYWVGQAIFDLYFTSSAVTHIYGTAGSIVVVLLWVYYAATILLFGAKFTWVYISKTRARQSNQTPSG